MVAGSVNIDTVEAKIERDACDLVWKHLGIQGSKLKVLGDDGYPDRIFWIPGGYPLLIEFKAPGESPRPKQAHIHKWLRRLGYRVEVFDNAVDAFECVISVVAAMELSKAQRKTIASAQTVCASLRKRHG